jgi:antitoxin (DNA-binding transcriptional repressor) of toxin-antitoxin stability system
VKHQTIGVTEFKTKCLALLDDVGKRGGTITITNRGKPLATVGRPKETEWKSLEGIFEGKFSIPDEILLRDNSDLWDCVREREASEKRR